MHLQCSMYNKICFQILEREKATIYNIYIMFFIYICSSFRCDVSKSRWSLGLVSTEFPLPFLWKKNGRNGNDICNASRIVNDISFFLPVLYNIDINHISIVYIHFQNLESQLHTKYPSAIRMYTNQCTTTEQSYRLCRGNPMTIKETKPKQLPPKNTQSK